MSITKGVIAMANILNQANMNVVTRSGKKQIQRRRQYLVHKKIQFRIAGELEFILVVGMILGLTNAHFINSIFLISSDLFNGNEVWYPNMSILMWIGVAVLIVVSLLVTFFLSLYFSNRVAGPARKIERSINAIRKGDLDIRIRLRKTDHLQEVAEELNKLVTQWNGTLSAIGENVRALKTETSHFGPQDIQDKLSAIESLLANLQQASSSNQPR